MRIAFGSNERETLKRESHSLRGSATYVGGNRVSACALALEKVRPRALRPRYMRALRP